MSQKPKLDRLATDVESSCRACGGDLMKAAYKTGPALLCEDCHHPQVVLWGSD